MVAKVATLAGVATLAALALGIPKEIARVDVNRPRTGQAGRQGWQASTIASCSPTRGVVPKSVPTPSQSFGRPTGGRKVIHVNIDDSIATKHKNTTHIDGVDWLYDHVESTKRRPHYKNGLTYLACTVATIVVTLDLRFYLRASTVRRLN